MFAKRSLAVQMMTVFDSCDTTAPTGRRDVSTVAPQALTLLNNAWVHGESQAMAERVIASGPTIESRIEAAWRIAFSRTPSATERQAAIDYVERSRNEGGDVVAWSVLCHTLINTNEFIYVD